MSLPAATSLTLSAPSRASTTALPGLTGQSGMPEVPSSGLPSPPSSPPLAAITSSNELALLPKSKKRSEFPGKRIPARRGGAALVIREECERFFCERMSTVFHGELDTNSNASGLNSAYMMQTPPAEDDAAFDHRYAVGGGRGRASVVSNTQTQVPAGCAVTAWLEIWDFEGGASFCAFVADDGEEKSLFVFFDGNVVGIDLKKALMALIELADSPLDCQHVVVCMDRRIPEPQAVGLMKSLQWVGFELTTIDRWAHDLDVTSKEWLFMGMEL